MSASTQVLGRHHTFDRVIVPKEVRGISFGGTHLGFGGTKSTEASGPIWVPGVLEVGKNQIPTPRTCHNWLGLNQPQMGVVYLALGLAYARCC